MATLMEKYPIVNSSVSFARCVNLHDSRKLVLSLKNIESEEWVEGSFNNLSS
jgi:hypothetical protein